MALFKKKKDYFFESFVELANYAKEAFLILEEGLKDFNASKAEELKNNVHLVEHKADLDKREIEEKLAKEFITPIDREDIFLLLDKIDDITDAIDEISYKLYMRNYDKLPSQINDFVAKSKEAILTMIELLHNMDKISSKSIIDPLTHKILDIEEEVDKLYEDNVRDLYKEEHNSYRELVMNEKVFSYFEYLTDKCRDVTKQIQIIMYKNL